MHMYGFRAITGSILQLDTFRGPLTAAPSAMHVNMSAALGLEPDVEVSKFTALISCDTATRFAAVQSRLSQLQVNHDPSDSELSSFLELSRQIRGTEVLTYFLIGNHWMKPTTMSWVNCCWGHLSQDQYHRRVMLEMADRIPVTVCNRLSTIVTRMFYNDDRFRRCTQYYLQYEYEVGTINDYNVPDPTFNFNPGFKADFSTSSQGANDIIVKGQGRQGESPCQNLSFGGIEANQADDIPKQGSASLLHDAATGTKVLAASVAMTEAHMVDILDYLCNAAFAWLKEARWNNSQGSCDWTSSAFKRLHWKLKMPQAAGVCTWATHLHFVLDPCDQDFHVHTHQAPSWNYGEPQLEDLDSIRPTHNAVAMSALSAIATLDPSQNSQQEQATCNTDASSLQQQLSSWSIPVPQLQQQAPPQPELDNTRQHAGLRPGTSAACDASILQVNMREVLGCGSTGVIFAGWYQNREVAVKVSQPFYEVREQRSKEDVFLHEVWAYRQLQQMSEIYGTLVPELLAFVRLPHDVLLLVMTRQGPSLSDYVNDNGNLPVSLKETVLSSLARLHSYGVVHGSPRFDNITLKPGSSDVCFIDLQRAGCHKYAWPRPDSFGEKWDASLEDWRELTSAEAIDEGAYRLADDIMTAVKLKVQEYRYVCMLLEQDYTDTRDCTTFQRDKLRWAIT